MKFTVGTGRFILMQQFRINPVRSVNFCKLTAMFLLPVILLLHYFLYVVQSAPISTADPFMELREVAERAKTLVQKILRDIPAVHTTAINTEVNEMSDWLLHLISSSLIGSSSCLMPSFCSSGSDSPVHPDHKPSADGDVTASPCCPSPQTTI